MEYISKSTSDSQNEIYYQGKRLAYRFFKRFFDIALSSIGLLLLTPVFVIVAILIKLDDPKGPVFYAQTRIGKRKEPFKMFKFRSMRVNADQYVEQLKQKNEIKGAMFKMKNDPRITRIGKFIRKYSIDELPQLLNVLLSDMSLVGPRPPLPREVSEYTAHDEKRLVVKPGCTGVWQVGGRSNVSFSQMVDMDLKYIDKCCLIFDLIILFKTVVVFIKPNGAY